MSPLQISSLINNAKFDSKKAVTFKGTVSTGIVTVKLQADDKWDIGSDVVDESGSWSITYPGFNQTGNRNITAIGFDETNQKKADSSVNIRPVGI